MTDILQIWLLIPGALTVLSLLLYLLMFFTKTAEPMIAILALLGGGLFAPVAVIASLAGILICLFMRTYPRNARLWLALVHAVFGGASGFVCWWIFNHPWL